MVGVADALHTDGAVVGAKEARIDDAGLIACQASSIDVRTGVLVAPGSTDLVTGTAATGTMTYAVAAHHWIGTRGAANGPYRGALEAATEVPTAAAPGSNSRIDVIWSRMQDSTAGVPTPDATSGEEYGVTSGEAAVSPVKPAIPVGAIELATATVAAGATATNGAGVTITNTARQTVARGARVPVRDQAERDGLTVFKGLEVYRLDTGAVELNTTGAAGGWATTYDPARPVGALLHGAGTQAVGTGAMSVVTLEVSVRAKGMTTDTASGRITATKAGIYLVSGMVSFTGNATGRRLAQVFKNGASVAQTTAASTPGAGTWRVPTCTYQIEMAAGDYLQLAGLQDSGGVIDFIRDECFLQASYVGPST